MKPGPVSSEQFRRLKASWNQGEHVLIAGPTGGGKTALARHVIQTRLDRGAHVIVFVGKLGEDETIKNDYLKDGFVRWEKFQKRPNGWQRKILLWPDTDKLKTIPAKRELQRRVFEDAFNQLSNIGLYTVQIDEGLYTCNPTFLNLSDHLAMTLQMGRSNGLSAVVLTQRPAHLPLVTYSSAGHAFIGRATEEADRKRLAEMGGKEGSKVLASKIANQGKHDFTWVPISPDWDTEPLNLKK
jgi:hypothetical protein